MVEALWSPQDVSAYTGVPLNTVNKWRWHSKGPPFMHIGKYVRYRKADVEQWLDAQRAEGPRAS